MNDLELLNGDRDDRSTNLRYLVQASRSRTGRPRRAIGWLATVAAMVGATDAVRGQNSWTLLATSGPDGRANARMAYDSARDRVVLYGGSDGILDDRMRETWEWNGSSWTLRSTGGPSRRAFHSMVYDGARGRCVLFGGFYSSNDYGDTWEWDGSTWSRRATTGPSPRSGHAMAFDSVRQVTVLFGGVTRGDPRDEYHTDTWEWNGSTWTERATSGPSARTDHVMAYDSVRQRVVMFGGIDANGALKGDTWEWNGSSWTQRATSGPSPRYLTDMVYDSARGVTVLFAGYVQGYWNRETWEWDGSAWHLAATSGPSERMGHAMAYDSARRRTVLFGGIVDTNSYSEETWGYAEAPGCNGSEILRASCQDKDNDVPPEGDDVVKGKLTGGTPGASYTFCLDGGRCSVEVANSRGVAKTKWNSVSDGNHTVTVTECGLSELTACP